MLADTFVFCFIVNKKREKKLIRNAKKNLFETENNARKTNHHMPQVLFRK